MQSSSLVVVVLLKGPGMSTQGQYSSYASYKNKETNRSDRVIRRLGLTRSCTTTHYPP